MVNPALKALLKPAAKPNHASKGPTTHVDPYVRTSTGANVDEHNRTTEDATTQNNWSTNGNINPETGVPGTKDPNQP